MDINALNLPNKLLARETRAHEHPLLKELIDVWKKDAPMVSADEVAKYYHEVLPSVRA